MDNQSDTPNAIDSFKLAILTRRITGPRFEPLFHRVATILNSSVAVHLWDRKENRQWKLWSEKKGVFCDLIASSPHCLKACDKDRAKIIKQIINLDIPLLFKCHVGFYCASVLLFHLENNVLVLTVGPFYIDENREVLEYEYSKNMSRYSIEVSEQDMAYLKQLPYLLSDSVREVLLWTKDSFQKEWITLFNTKDYVDRREEKVLGQNGETELEEGKVVRLEKFDRVRENMFLVALRTKNKELMEIVLRGKGDEIRNSRSNLSQALFLLYIWSINVITSRLFDYGLDTFIDKRILLCVGQENFQNVKGLDSGVKRIRKIIFSSLAPEFFSDNTCVFKKKQERFESIVSEMRNYLWAPNLMKLIEKRLGMNVSALSHWLKRNVDSNYEDLLSYIQVEKTAESLRKTDESLSRVSIKVGVKYSSHLSAKFKKVTGCNPSEYRAYFARNLNVKGKNREQ
ncbi:MAG: helix-turn-helix domain-containing protein [Candidatus Hydrogenedens sp.]|nr:helix-turn-helix domain-containing protein [Candidatus Hydrogenedens sp.]